MPLFRLIPLVLLAAAPAFLADPQVAAGLSGTVVSSVKVTVPQDNTELKVNGKVIEGTGKVREFKTEELKDGETYKYTFSAFWEPNNYTKITRTKTVSFVAGKDVVVDLSKPDPANPDAV